MEKNENGVPNIRISKDGYENYKFRVSLSHNEDTATASVVVIKQ